jgi:hypothetical protein
MTESQAIEACKKKAIGRRTRLGSDISAFLNDDFIASKVPQAQLPIGHWSVVFRDSGFDTEQYFTVNDSTGAVIWENEPPSKWVVWLLSFVMFPLLFLLIPFAFIIERLHTAWKYYQLPRCPYCRGKLRTNSAEQCFTCGKAWHHVPGQDR